MGKQKFASIIIVFILICFGILIGGGDVEALTNGSCGSSNGQSFYIPPTTNLCNAGNASSVTTNSTQFTWTCSGIDGGSTASCSSNQLTRSRPCLKYGDINQSGAINYYDLILAFEQLETLALDLIDVNGSSSADFNDIIDIQDYVNGTISTFSVCSKIVNGSCGTANGKTYLYSASSYGSDTQCAAGTSTNTAFPAAGNSVSWVCNGAYGGSNSGTCSASRYASAPVNGSCGTANGKTYLYSASSYGSDTQCASGTSTNTNFPAAGGSVSWVCNGAYGGSNSGTCSAYRSIEVINGVCGSSNGGTFSSAPTTNLCSVGNASGVTTNSTTYTWTCAGSGGGSTASCSATRTVNGACGTANGHGYYATSEIDTAAEQCSAGTFTSFTDNGSSWSWACNGINGGTNANCSANKVVCGSSHNTIRRDQPSSNLCSYGTNTSLTLTSNVWYWSCTNNPGVNAACYAYKTTCGSSNGGTFSSAPTTNLCIYGTASSVTTGDTTFTWTCTGNDSLAVSCSANRTLNGSCGTANGHGYYATSEIDTAAEQCSAGTFTSFTDNGSSWSWACNGSNGGTNASCSANKVVCGSVYNTTRKDQPSSNLCSYGTNTSLTLISNIWYWSCTNNPGMDAACYTYKTTCGSSNDSTFSSAPTTNLCAYGTASSVTTGDTTYTWTCTGNDSLAVSCSANRTVNGSCGTANGKTYLYSASSYGSDTQCATGTPSSTSFPAAGATTTWTCSGVNGGSASGTCSASRSSEAVDGVCGTANGQIYSASPSSNLCSVGTPGSVTTNTLTYTWTCTGSGGGTTANCSADRITFKNPSEIDSTDFGNTDGSCFYCEHYYDSNGVLRTGSLDVATKTANPKLRFTIDNTKYTQYKIKVGTVETATWTSITGSTVTYTGLKVGEGVSSDSASGTTLTITYGNGTTPKSYNWSVNLKKSDNTETGWISAGTFTTPAKPYPIVKLNPVAQSAYSSIVKYCTTTDSLIKSADTSGCFDTCWKGAGTTADLSSSDWKCSVCFNTSGQRTLCSTSNTTFTWKLPTAEIGTYQNSTNSNSPNPLFLYNFSAGSFKPGLRIAGSECSGEGETTGVPIPLPTWLEGR